MDEGGALKKTVEGLVRKDPLLGPYRKIIRRRLERTADTEQRLTGRMSLADFASGHEYFGLHFRDGRWVFREWSPTPRPSI